MKTKFITVFSLALIASCTNQVSEVKHDSIIVNVSIDTTFAESPTTGELIMVIEEHSDTFKVHL